MEGTASVIAENVSRLRAARKLSQTVLASKAGLSRLALAKIEKGETVPRAATLRALAAALDVSSFDLAAPVRKLESVRFRAKKKLRERSQILAEVANWIDDYRFLEEELHDRSEFRLAPLLKEERVSEEELARRVRGELGIGADAPLHDICGVLAKCGIKVLHIPRATDAFFGLSVASEEGGPAIVINTWDRISVERWIFSAAHELGHLLLHQNAYISDEEEELDSEEREADAFAGFFLMPRSAFLKEWRDAAGHPFYERVLKIKRIFHVSYKTVLRRLQEEMNAPAPAIYRKFQFQHMRRFRTSLKKTDEPDTLSECNFDSRYAQEEPDRLSNVDFMDDRLAWLVRKAIEADVINIGRGGEIMRVPLEEMRIRAREWNE